MSSNNLHKDSYNGLVKSIQGFNLELLNLSVNKHGEEEPDNLTVHLSFSTHYRNQTDYQYLMVDCFFDLIALDSKLEIESDTFEEVKDKLFQTDNKPYYFQIKFDMALTYKLETKELFTEELLELFANKNTPVNIWPYARELISSLTTRMGLRSPLMLAPLVNKVK